MSQCSNRSLNVGFQTDSWISNNAPHPLYPPSFRLLRNQMSSAKRTTCRVHQRHIPVVGIGFDGSASLGSRGSWVRCPGGYTVGPNVVGSDSGFSSSEQLESIPVARYSPRSHPAWEEDWDLVCRMYPFSRSH
jgi:hypothetical protein